ncbi:MAG: hypothetical protein ACJ76H_05775 [Bacteriovoracaceae bacterium]
MNGVDYTRRLTKEREYFKDALKKNNEANQRQVEDQEKRHALVQDKMSKNYLDNKSELEKSYQSNLNNISDKNREAMDHQTDKFLADRKEEREAFAKEAEFKSKDFDQRLNDIKHSYKRAFKNQDETDATIRETEKNRYNKNVKQLALDQDKHLKNYQSEMQGAGADMKDAIKREKEQLIRTQEDTIADMNRRHFDERDSIKNRLSSELTKVKDVHASEQAQLRDYTQDKVSKTEKVATGRVENMTKEYSDRYEADVRKQHKENVKTNREYEEQYAKVRREAQDQLRQQDNIARRRDNGENEFNDAVTANRDFNGKAIEDHKMKNLKNALDDTRRTYEEMAAQDATDRAVANEKERAQNQAFVDKTTNKLKAEKMLTVADERMENQNRLDHQERQGLVKSKDYEHQLMQEKKLGDTRVKNLKENFHKSMTEIEDKLRANIEDVTRSANSDKKDFMRRTSEQTIQQLADMKSEFNRHLDQTVQSYEFRLSNAQKNLDELRMHTDQKMESMARTSEQELDHERKTGAERRNAEVRGLKSAIDEQEHKHRMEVNNMMVNYQKQLAKIQAQNDLKLKLISNDYETKLKEANASKSRELAETQNVNRAEMERLKSNYTDDKQRLVSGYEAKLQQLKDHHETQMQQLNDFKKLS